MYIGKDTLVSISLALFPVGLAAAALVAKACLGGRTKRASLAQGVISLLCVSVAVMGTVHILDEIKSYDFEKMIWLYVLAGQITDSAGNILLAGGRETAGNTALRTRVGLWLKCIANIVFAAGVTVYNESGFFSVVLLILFSLAASAAAFRLSERHREGRTGALNGLKLPAFMYIFAQFSCLMLSWIGNYNEDIIVFICLGSIFSAVSGAVLCRELFAADRASKPRVWLRYMAGYIGQYIIALSLLRSDL